MRPRRLTAAWVVPVEGAPIRRGAILTDELGRIAAVGPDASVARPDGAASEHFPDAALLPGLVNAHTHLELTGLASAVDPADFAAWIRDLREQKAARTPADFLAAARAGIADCRAAGITTVADTGDSGAAVEALHQLGASGIAYHEVFGPHPDQRDASLAGLQARVAELRRFTSGRVRLGVSPHAPYSVSGPLYAAVARWSREAGLPIAVHIAESAAESALLGEGSGAFADLWTRRGIPLPPPPGHTPIEWLAEHGVLGETTLCIHVVRADRADVSRLASSGSAVAHCPLSNAAHGHGAAPLALLLGAGVRVGVGTDSPMSVGALDLMAAARAARALAGLDAEAALALCTLGGAQAIGLGQEVGSLAAGKWADVAAIRVDPGVDPVEAVLASSPGDVAATFASGEPVYRAAAPVSR